MCETPTGSTSEIHVMRRNPADQAGDKLYEIGVKLSFILESAAFLQINNELTEAGISGLWHMLNHIQDDVLEVGRQLAASRAEMEGRT